MNSSEDESSDNDTAKSAHPDAPRSERGATISQCVQELGGRGHGGELQWLQAYLMDEARDRTLDGKLAPPPFN